MPAVVGDITLHWTILGGVASARNAFGTQLRRGYLARGSLYRIVSACLTVDPRRRFLLLANRLASGRPAHRRRDRWQAGVTGVHPHDPIGSPSSPTRRLARRRSSPPATIVFTVSAALRTGRRRSLVPLIRTINCATDIRYDAQSSAGQRRSALGASALFSHFFHCVQ